MQSSHALHYIPAPSHFTLHYFSSQTLCITSLYALSNSALHLSMPFTLYTTFLQPSQTLHSIPPSLRHSTLHPSGRNTHSILHSPALTQLHYVTPVFIHATLLTSSPYTLYIFIVLILSTLRHFSAPTHTILLPFIAETFYTASRQPLHTPHYILSAFTYFTLHFAKSHVYHTTFLQLSHTLYITSLKLSHTQHYIPPVLAQSILHPSSPHIIYATFITASLTYSTLHPFIAHKICTTSTHPPHTLHYILPDLTHYTLHPSIPKTLFTTFINAALTHFVLYTSNHYTSFQFSHSLHRIPHVARMHSTLRLFSPYTHYTTLLWSSHTLHYIPPTLAQPTFPNTAHLDSIKISDISE